MRIYTSVIALFALLQLSNAVVIKPRGDGDACCYSEGTKISKAWCDNGDSWTKSIHGNKKCVTFKCKNSLIPCHCYIRC